MIKGRPVRNGELNKKRTRFYWRAAEGWARMMTAEEAEAAGYAPMTVDVSIREDAEFLLGTIRDAAAGGVAVVFVPVLWGGCANGDVNRVALWRKGWMSGPEFEQKLQKWTLREVKSRMIQMTIGSTISV